MNLMKRFYYRILILVLAELIACATLYAQASSSYNPHIEKRYNLFFRINSYTIEEGFKDNKRTLEQMRKDIETTLELDGTVPDSLTILATASPDGSVALNKRLANNRARSTKKLLLELFPEFKNAHIVVEHLEEDWDGLKQVLLAHPEFPQRDEMLKIIDDDKDVQYKEQRLRALKKGWRYLVENYIYALRNSSITIKVVMTADNSDDEFVRGKVEAPSSQRDTAKAIEPIAFSHTPTLDQPTSTIPVTYPGPGKYRKTIFAARSNLLMPGLSIGLEFPIHENWSIGINYNYPWAVSKHNKWCVEKLSLFLDAKYWFTNEKTAWTPDSRLKGHGVGLYAGTGYYDFQNIARGAQGEFINFGVDYLYALPVANDKLRIEFNLGIGFIKTWYRPYTPSTDFEDLIKEPGVKYRSTDFFGPTRAGISLVYPITVPVKKSPWIKMGERMLRKAERQEKKAGGKND